MPAPDRVGSAAVTDGETHTVQRRAARLVASGLLDVEFYAAQVGRNFASDTEAARHAITVGMPGRLGFNPFVDFVSMPQQVRRAWRAGRVGALLKHLAGEGRTAPYSPLFDPARARHAGAGNPLVEFLRTSTDETPLPVAADRVGIVPTRGAARAAMLAMAREVASGAPLVEPLVDWTAVEEALPGRVPRRTSVVIPTYEDWFMTTRAVQAVLLTTEGQDVEVVVVDNGSAPHVPLALAAAFVGNPAVRLVRLPENTNFAGGSNIGFARSTGDHVVFLNNDTRVRRSWLAPLLAALEDDEVAGAQALLLYPDETIQSAGTVFLDAELLPAHLLVGHPPQDAAGVAGRRFSAATAAALAMRSADVAALRAFDPAYRNGFEDVDLSLRALALRPGGFRVVTDSVVTHYESKSPGRFARAMDNRRLFGDRWRGRLPVPEPEVYAELGWQLELPVRGDGQPVPAARPVVTGRLRRDPDRLRWGLHIPSTGGHWGDLWGDTHFAEELAAGLRRLGQEVVLHRRDAHDGDSTAYDDVCLVLRGVHRGSPPAGQASVLWVISHPDDVADDELDDYDLVFAASVPWAQERSRATGIEVRPLLQATGMTPAAGGERSAAAVFVGNGEQRDRAMVRWAVEAGVPLEVYGRGWEWLPPGAWRAEFLPNDQLERIYRSHAAVLADHWEDMARLGFVANRVFDAVAGGAHVLCDDVVGLGDLFGDRVRVCRSAADVRAAYDAALADPDMPVAGPGLSFDDRARELLAAVRGLRAADGV